MNRRRFIAVAVMAPVAAVIAAKLPSLMAKPETGPLTQTIAFTSSRNFEPGDMITLTFADKAISGTYRMNGVRIFEKVT